MSKTPDVVTPTCDESTELLNRTDSPTLSDLLKEKNQRLPSLSQSEKMRFSPTLSERKSVRGQKRKGFLATLRERLYLRKSAKSKAEEIPSIPSQDLSSCKHKDHSFFFGLDLESSYITFVLIPFFDTHIFF